MKIKKLFIISVIVIALLLIGFGIFKYITTESYKGTPATENEKEPPVVDEGEQFFVMKSPAPPPSGVPSPGAPPSKVNNLKIPSSEGDNPQVIENVPPPEEKKHHKVSPKENPEIQRAEDLLQQNNLAGAEKLIRALSVRNPEKARIILLQGELLQKKGKFRKAYEKYKKAIKLDPKNSLAITRMTEVCQILDKPTEGLKYMNMPGKFYAFSGFENILKADLYLQSAFDKKIRGDKSWKKDVNSAEKIYGEIKDFDSPEVPIVRGKIEYLRGNREKALQYFKKAVSNPSLSPTYKVDILTAIAKLYIDSGNPDKALPYLDAIIVAAGKWKPDSFDTSMTYPEYALILRHKFFGKPLNCGGLKARKLFYKTLKKKGIQIEGYDPEKEIDMLADIMFPLSDSTSSKKLEKAKVYLSRFSDGKNLPHYFSEKVFHRTNRKMLAYIFIAEALEKKNNYKGAIKSLNKALSFSPGNKMIKKKIAELRKSGIGSAGGMSPSR